MVGTPDRRAGRLEEEEILLDDLTAEADPEDVRSIRYTDDAFRFVDGTATFDPRLVDRDDHEVIDSLTHAPAEDGYEEFTYIGNVIADVILWQTVAKLLKIREWNYTYTANKVTTEVIKQYDEAGSLLKTLTLTFAYTGNKLASTTYVVS